MSSFLPRRLYTRPEIAEQVGGGHQDYLPHSNGRVVAACLSDELNPDAPHVVLRGNGPEIIRWARVLADQPDPVPTFMKRAPNAWQYVGQFRATDISFDETERERWARVSGRDDIAAVLYLERVS